MHLKSRGCVLVQPKNIRPTSSTLCCSALGWAVRYLLASAWLTKPRSWIHMLIFAGTLTITLYVVTNMEFPRLGLVRIEDFDHFLIEVHGQRR